MTRHTVTRLAGSRPKGYVMPAVRVQKMTEMIERGEFIDWVLRQRRLSRKIRRGLPSDKTIGRRLKTIGLQLSGR